MIAIIDYGVGNLFSLRCSFEKIGAEIEWDGVTQTVTAKKDDTTIELTINNTNAKKNGEIIDKMDIFEMFEINM